MAFAGFLRGLAERIDPQPPQPVVIGDWMYVRVTSGPRDGRGLYVREGWKGPWTKLEIEVHP